MYGVGSIHSFAFDDAHCLKEALEIEIDVNW